MTTKYFGKETPTGAGTSMKVLILSCNTGEGHNSAARAIADAAGRMGHEAVIRDFLTFRSEKYSARMSNSYIRAAKYIPHGFGAFYQFGLIMSPILRPFHSPMYRISRKMTPQLEEYIKEEGFDAIVATHFFPAEAVACMKDRGFDVPVSVAVATDYTVVPFWEECRCDYYILPHADLANAFTKRHIPAETLRPLGIPVSAKFSNLPSREDAKRALGLDAEHPFYLIMGGSMGAGHIRAFTKKLYRQAGDGTIAVICGTNDSLRETLEKRFADCPNVRIVGFTTEIPTYMAACDVLYTKPGGLTSTEAVVCGAPTVHTAPIPGCESRNSRFFRAHGLSMPAHTIRRQLRCGRELAGDPALAGEMRAHQKESAIPDSAERIVRLLEEGVRQKQETCCEKET